MIVDTGYSDRATSISFTKMNDRLKEQNNNILQWMINT